MSYDMSTTLLTVIGVLAGIGALLYVMAVLDPTSTPTIPITPNVVS